MQDYTPILKQRFRELIACKRVTIIEVAALLGCTRQRVSVLLKDDNSKVPSAVELKQLADYFGVSTESFFTTHEQLLTQKTYVQNPQV